MKIYLSKGRFAAIDDEDFPLIAHLKFHASERRFGRYYAAAKIKGKNVYLHRILMQPAKGQVVDHIDGDGLNNKRSNLRICTQSQNVANSRSRSGKLKGIWQIHNGRWTAQVAKDGKRYHLGYFSTPDEAFEAYKLAAKRLHGEFTRT